MRNAQTFLRMEKPPLRMGDVPFTDGNAAARTFGRAHRRRPYHFSCGSVFQGCRRTVRRWTKSKMIAGEVLADGQIQEMYAGEVLADGQIQEMIAGEVLADGQIQEMIAGEQFDDRLKLEMYAGEQFADGQTQEMYAGEQFADGLKREKVAGE